MAVAADPVAAAAAAGPNSLPAQVLAPQVTRVAIDMARAP